MKAKIRKTGEIVDVTENRIGYTLNDLDFGNDEDEHWRDVREHAVIAALQGAVSRSHCIEHCVKFAVDCADALVEELKKKQQ